MRTHTDIKNLISHHERQIQILEAINSFHRRKQVVEENLKHFGHHFQKLARSYENRIDTIERAITRLELMYERHDTYQAV